MKRLAIGILELLTAGALLEAQFNVPKSAWRVSGIQVGSVTYGAGRQFYR